MGVRTIGKEVCRRLLMTALVLGVLAAPATSSALELFHSPDPNGTVRVTLPLSVPEGSPADLNLWMNPDDPNDDGVLAFDMVVTSSGSLTFSFACALGGFCFVGEDPDRVGISAFNLAPSGWEVPFKVGTFNLNADGSVGDELTLDSGSFELEILGEGAFAPAVLAVVVVPCDDAICSGGCGDVNEDGVFDPNDPAALRLHLADPSGGVLTADGLARCAVIGDPVGCSIRQVVVMRRALQEPPLPPGLAPVCDCCIEDTSPGCSDPFTESCVCELDPSCCTTAWDDACVSEADSDCGTCSATPAGP
jgi:hypothetical protein